MSFISTEFLFFFAVVVVIYFALLQRWRWGFLLAASLIFYAYAGLGYLALMILLTLLSYFAAQRMDRLHEERSRQVLLFASIAANLGVLFIFKYLDFFGHALEKLARALDIAYESPPLDIILPLGISFYTFQCIAYMVDVYRKTIPPEPSLGIFATYIAFFPKLIAGPIERAGHLLPQFRQKFHVDEARMVEGLRRILWGVFKKVVIADRLAVYVNVIYDDPGSYSGLPLIVAAIFFAFQIYCDFSSYSDIAIGAAQVLGFRLMENFRQPYHSTSIREFWRRWHISLSTWFRDYLYIPLGGSRVRLWRVALNVMIVFVASGLWHGAAWTFVFWGGLHGAYLVAELLLARFFPGQESRPDILLVRLFKLALTFTLVCLAWIYFRADTLADAGYIVSNLFNFVEGAENVLNPYRESLLTAEIEFVLAVGSVAFLILMDWIDARWGISTMLTRRPDVVRWAFYYAVAISIGVSLWFSATSTQDFIYFQF